MIHPLRYSAAVLFVFSSLYVVAQDSAPLHNPKLNAEINYRQKRLDSLRKRVESFREALGTKQERIFSIDRQIHISESSLKRSQDECVRLESEIANLNNRLNQERQLLDGFLMSEKRSLNEPPLRHQARLGILGDMVRKQIATVQDLEQRIQIFQKTLKAEKDFQDRVAQVYLVTETEQKLAANEALRQDKEWLNQQSTQERKIGLELARLKAQAQVLEDMLKKHIPLTIITRDPITGPNLSKMLIDEASFAERIESKVSVPFSQLKGRLPAPVLGEIVREFGPYTLPDSAVTMESSGIDYLVSGNYNVSNVAEGQVFFTGHLDVYGELVAIDHGEGYVTVYGNVKPDDLRAGQIVSAGRILGTVQEIAGQAILHFEIRKDNQAVNPRDWIRN